MISIILILLASIFNSCMDVLKTRWSKSIFRFWPNQDWIDPTKSWKNKWMSKYNWVDFIMSTSLVFLTDFWHLCKFLMIVLFCLSAILYKPLMNNILDLLIFYCTFTITFEVFYSKILIKK
ncbi:MAG: hypothetical protein PHF86_01985 [Candidatus Nanoarchaeia archaeon]|nr:hypothetical protein [Candidatus Nanoarchaeia archaeon]